MRILPFRSSATVSVDVCAVLNHRFVSVRYVEHSTGNTFDVVAEAPAGLDAKRWFVGQSFQQKMRWLDEGLAASRHRSLASRIEATTAGSAPTAGPIVQERRAE